MSKKNREYWRKRFELLADAQFNKSAEYYNSLEAEYSKAEKAMQTQINAWYGRFAINNNISLAEAKQLLNSKELEEFKWDVNEYIKYGKENALNGMWMKELENASAKVHISRLEALKIQLQQQVEVLYGNQVDSIDKLARDIYTNGYYHTAYEIQKGFNVGYSFQALNNNQVTKVISKPWAADGSNFTAKCWAGKTNLVNVLHTELTQSIIRGDAPDRAIKVISKQLDVSKKRAGRLVMTESAFFAAAAQKDCYKELDVEKYEIVATLDSHTSEICQGLDGKVFDMKDYEVGITAPPFHPWCRTCTVPYFEDNYGERAAKGAEGKTYYVPSDMTYKKWHNRYVKGNPAEELAEKKVKASYADKKQYEEYKKILGKDIPKSFDDFQDMKYTDSKQWKDIKTLYRQVSWQVKAQENLVQSSVHKVPPEAQANSVFDNYRDGKLESRRYYGKTGKPRLDIDLTDHRNSKEHPIVPHAHDWNFKDIMYDDVDPELQGRLKVGRELSKAEMIANKNILKGGI